MSIGAIALTLVTGIVLVLALLDVGPFADPDDDPGPAARSDESEEPVPSPDEATGPLDDQGALLSDHMLVSVTDETGASRIAAVDTDSGESTTLTEGPGDRLPVLSPDRETLIFLRREGDQAAVPYVVDLASDEQPRPLFAEGHPCSYSGRPAWDLSGERMAVMCTDSAGGFVALHLLDPEGADIATVPLEAIPRGAPTWISPSMLVYTRDGTAGVPSSLWAVDVDTGEETALTADAGAWDSHPDWSEAAGLLLFSRSPVDQFYGELWTLDRAREPARIDVGRPVAHPVWGPGGGSVAVTVRNEDDSESLAIVRTNDPGALEVLELDGEPGVPVWDSR